MELNNISLKNFFLFSFWIRHRMQWKWNKRPENYKLHLFLWLMAFKVLYFFCVFRRQFDVVGSFIKDNK